MTLIGLLVKGLRRHPLKVESRVQISYRLPFMLIETGFKYPVFFGKYGRWSESNR